MHPTTRTVATALALAGLAATGCARMGPRTVAKSRLSYNEAVARSGDEQLLLNLVRLRYRDNPLFLDITSVVTQYTFSAEATAGATLETGADALELGADLTYSEEPTVSYSPLQGSDFVTRFLTPVSPSILFLLSQSGWSVERLLLCCVQKVNDLPNAVAAAGPTPDYIPRFQEFHRLARALRRLQVAGFLGLELREKDLYLRFVSPSPGSEEARDLEEVRSLLGLRDVRGAYRLREDTLSLREKDEIDFTGRSLLAVMFFLSQAVEAPELDEKEGRVTVTRSADGEPFHWSQVTGPLLRIRSAPERPSRASVRVLYRGSWFYIDDSDLNSKSTFNLLSYLLALKSDSASTKAPLLTLGVD